VRVWLLLGGVGLGAALFLAFPEDGLGQAVTFLVVNGAAFAALLVNAHRIRERFWLLLIAGEALYLTASCIWWLYPLAFGPLPYPSPVDALYLASYCLFLLFVSRLLRTLSELQQGAWAEAVAIALGTGALLYALLEATLPSLRFDLAWVTSFAYPLVLVLMAFWAARALLASSRSAFVLLILAWLTAELVGTAFFVVESADGEAAYRSVPSLAWMVSYAALVAIAFHPEFGRRPTFAATPQRRGSVLVALGVITSLPLAAIGLELHRAGQHEGLITVGAAAAVSFLMLRRTRQLASDLRVEREQAAKLRELTEALEHQALHDSLTGLRNRTVLETTLPDLLRGHDGIGRIALALVDIDNFKSANDTFGHVAGDEILKAVARRLASVCTAEQVIARTGGDEFCVIAHVATTSEAEALAGRLVTALDEAVSIEHIEFRVQASIGIAVSDESISAIELVRRADMAMYAQKTRDGGGHTLYSCELAAEIEERRRVEIEIGVALEHDQLAVHYQPIVSLSDSSIVGVEALLRWDHPRHGLLAAGSFIEAAEVTGHVRRIGQWLLATAASQVVDWNDRTGAGLTLFVNAAPVELLNAGYPEAVGEILEAVGMEPWRVSVEVTESALGRDDKAIGLVLTELRSHGLRIALDDFGTGYSSLASLASAPIDIVKLDRAFVDGISQDARAFALATSVAELSQSLGKKVIAEGVETAAQVAHLRAMGCELAQGYYFCRPLPAEEIEAMLRDQGPIVAARPT